jgi:transposase InsO family protein
MRRMGIEALYCRPRTTTPEPGHKLYPYLLRGIEIARPNQVWAMDITYISQQGAIKEIYVKEEQEVEKNASGTPMARANRFWLGPSSLRNSSLASKCASSRQ